MLNVYVVSSDPNWTSSMPAAAKVEIQANAHSTSFWETVKDALAYGHNLVGSFNTRPLLPLPNLYLSKSYDGLSNNVELIRSDTCPNERQRIQAMRKSDCAFVWVTPEFDAAAYADALMLYGLGKELVVACSDHYLLTAVPMITEVMYHSIARVCKDFENGYITTMGDIEVKIARGFAMLTAKYGGLCRGCGGSYSIGESIMWSRTAGVYHLDCHSAQFIPDKVNAAMLNSGIVSSVREKLAELEKENTDLMVKNSMLEKQLKEHMTKGA